MKAESGDYLPVNGSVEMRMKRLNLLLGTEISSDEAGDILRRLNMQLSQTPDGWKVVAPSSRFDIAIEEDLIEEVARIYGYDRIPEAAPTGVVSVGSAASRNVPLDRIRAGMNAAGYEEAINYSFVDPALLAAFGMAEGALPLANPLASDMSVMRTSLIPGLVVNLARNTRRQQGRVRLFETGVTFWQADSLIETQRIAAVACGSARAEQWAEPQREVDFYDIKGEVESLLALRGGADAVRFESEARPCTHPGASAGIYRESGGESVRIGWCAVLHPGVLKALEIRQAVVAFELDLELLQEREVQIAKEYSRVPSVRRDFCPTISLFRRILLGEPRDWY
jgi:phenylalanyl-tRNA synthetase beta chain